MSHTCHAAECKVAVAPKLLMCPRHWYMVPPDVQRLIWAHYERGQEISKAPTIAYCAVQSLAVALVAKAEKRTALAYQAMIRALKYTKQLPEGQRYDFIRGRISAEVLPPDVLKKALAKSKPKRKKDERLTYQQKRVLENLAAGLRWNDHARGQSQHGGLTRTLRSLVARGYVRFANPPAITKKGEEKLRQTRTLEKDR